MKKLKPCNLKGIGIDLTEDELEVTGNFVRTFREFCEKWHLECSVDTLRWYFANAEWFEWTNGGKEVPVEFGRI